MGNCLHLSHFDTFQLALSFYHGPDRRKSQSMWEGEPASPKDDALAAIVIVLLTLAADAVSYYLLGSLPISFLVYWGLIYFAFQLKGIGDLITFWFIQGIVTFGLMWLGIVPLFMLAQA